MTPIQSPSHSQSPSPSQSPATTDRSTGKLRAAGILGFAALVTMLAMGPLEAQFGSGIPGGGAGQLGGGRIGGGTGFGQGSGSGRQGGGLSGGGSGFGNSGGLPGGGSGFGNSGSPFGGGGFSSGSGFGPFGGSGRGGSAPGSAGRGDGGIGGFAMAPGQSVELAAACTDLFLEAPDATTRMEGGAGSEVFLSSGDVVGLDRALASEMLVLTGTPRSATLFGPSSPLLKLRLTNASQQRLAVRVLPGTHVIPQGQSTSRLSGDAAKLFTLARDQKLPDRVLQQAVWAARGSSLEDVEQTQITRVAPKDAERVQQLLDEAGLKLKFDRGRSEYVRRYEDAQDAISTKSAPAEVRGSAFLQDGSKVAIEGMRAADGNGVVTLKPQRREGEFRYRAEFTSRKDGRLGVKLFHLVTGAPLPAQKSLLVYPASG